MKIDQSAKGCKMELNKMHEKALEVSRIIREVFRDRVKYTEIYDAADQDNYHGFKIRFMAYDYFGVIFQCEQDIIGCSLAMGNDFLIPVTEGQYCLSDTDLNKYFNDVKEMIELRIPDKYLKAKGWFEGE